MNMDQIWGLLRTGLTAVVAYLAGRGLIPANIVPADFVAAIVTLAMAVWSFLGKTTSATVSKAAAMVYIPETSQTKAGIDTPITPTPGV